MKKGNERKQFKELLILNNSLKLGIKQVRGYLSFTTTVDTFIYELSCKVKELKGLKFFEVFDFYDDSKRRLQNTTNYIPALAVPFTIPIHKIAFPDVAFNFVDLLEMSKEKVNVCEFVQKLSTYASNSPLMPCVEGQGKEMEKSIKLGESKISYNSPISCSNSNVTSQKSHSEP